MNDFKKLQLIYEGGGMSVAGAGNPRYAPDPRDSGMHTYPNHMDFNKGNTGSNAYSVAAAAGSAGQIEAEEETVSGVIQKKIVVDKLNDLLLTANKNEMQYAVHILGSLKEFIKAHA